MPGTSYQLHTAGNAGYYRSQPYQSFRSSRHDTPVHSVSTIEENRQMEEWPMRAGGPSDYGSQYTGYNREDDTHGRHHYAEGHYFNDGYSVEKQSYEGDDGYGEYTFQE
jgi:hypothetical protein